jgi:D-3-phosphoglycerate dehydrogenase
MMISLLRRVPEAAAATRAGQWAQIKGGQLSGRVIGIIGCGHVGKELAPLLTAFRCTVLVHDIRSFPDFYAKYGIQPVDLPTLLNRSDIVTLHVPLDETTRGILDAQRLLSMKPGAILINAARGGLVDESAAVEMLKQGRLSGAAFDVFAEEPPTNSELLHLPNVLALPHIGGSTEEAILAMGRAAIAGLEDARIPTADLWGAGTS